MSKKRAVLTICHLEHKEVWRLTSSLLPRFVEADSYHVFVPQGEVAEFSRVTAPGFEIHAQESISSQYHEPLLRAVESAGNVRRFGWYLQQFHKIQALQTLSAESLVIWDADCVPLKPMQLFSPDGTPIFMRARENHAPYFAMIERLLGLERVQDRSFIVPGFPIRQSWVDDFIRAIQDRNPSLDWFEAVIAATDFTLQSGFSETETLGTWIANSYPGQWISSDVAWERRGQSRYGFARDFSVQEVIELGDRENLDIVSFENWDMPNNGKKKNVVSRIAKGLASMRR
jgi:hypothetical protein